MTVIAGGVADSMKKVIAAYATVNPNVEVNLDILADADHYYNTYPSTVFIDPVAKPDLAWFWCTTGANYTKLIDAGALEQLDDLYNKEDWKNAFPKGIVDYYTSPDGHQYGVNNDLVSLPYLYYNVDKFKELGLEPPKTWADMYVLVDKIRAAGLQPLATNTFGHTVVAFFMSGWTEAQYSAMNFNWSSSSTKEQQAYKWTDPDSVALIQAFQDMYSHNVIADGMIGITDGSLVRGLFTSGKALIFQDGSWSAGSLPTEATFKVGYFYYPPVKQYSYGQAASYMSNCFIVPKGGKHLTEVKDFLAFTESKKGMEQYIQGGKNPTGRTDLDSAVVATALGPLGAQMLTDAGKFGSPMLWSSVMDGDYNKSSNDILIEAMAGKITANDAATKLQELLETTRKSK
jgi:ABC-type glycerol-3-phosphate transport system substrate-binding protein